MEREPALRFGTGTGLEERLEARLESGYGKLTGTRIRLEVGLRLEELFEVVGAVQLALVRVVRLGAGNSRKTEGNR